LDSEKCKEGKLKKKKHLKFENISLLICLGKIESGKLECADFVFYLLNIEKIN